METKDYFEVYCKCGYKCDGLLYADIDVDKNRNKLIMIGADDNKESVSIWITAWEAREFANKLIVLADKIEREKYE